MELPKKLDYADGSAYGNYRRAVFVGDAAAVKEAVLRWNEYGALVETMRENECPAQWYQHYDDTKKPEWEECITCGRFSSCEHFENKAECWRRSDYFYFIQTKDGN